MAMVVSQYVHHNGRRLGFFKNFILRKTTANFTEIMHLSMSSRGERGGGDFDKTFMPGGMAFDFMDSPQDADI